MTDNDTTPRITGIGGIFYETENPFKTREWYNKHLNLSIDEWGAVFEFRNANNKEQINYLRWGPAQKGAGDFYPTKSNLMINYRVNNIEGMIRNLRSAGVIFVDNIQEFDYGKFIHFIDLDSNKVELWEPNDAALTKLAGKTNK
ncbi:MAG: VOC family protein [Bacteroidia bacterium]